jgi:hypothetical protein
MRDYGQKAADVKIVVSFCYHAGAGRKLSNKVAQPLIKLATGSSALALRLMSLSITAQCASRETIVISS